MKRTEEEKKRFTHVCFAHRGLYDESVGVPENSLAAFKRAVENGFGIELDVQLSSDGQVMVFHDDDLDRMTGQKGKIWDFTKEELQKLRLSGTDETIPLFSDVLNVLKEGNMPSVIELKTGPRNDELCEKTLQLLSAYPGEYCIESFNPFMVDWFKKHAPHIFRGQLATSPEEYKGLPKIVGKALSAVWLSWLNKPDFIAYDMDAETPKRALKLRKKGVLLIAWTLRDTKRIESAKKAHDSVIFEHVSMTPRY